jgi:hypothetical protein
MLENQRDLQSTALRPTLHPRAATTTNVKLMSCLIFAHRTRRNPGEVGRNLAEISGSKTPESELWRGLLAVRWWAVNP